MSGRQQKSNPGQSLCLLLLPHDGDLLMQASEWLHATVQSKESSLSEGWLYLEKEERWENDSRRPHEAEGAGCGVHLRVLRPLGYFAHLPPALLLATTEPGPCLSALFECPTC
jgi:hypothetical protein